MSIDEAVNAAGTAVEVAGVVILGVGVVVVFVTAGTRLLSSPDDSRSTYKQARQGLGRALLLGLEVLVAGDIIRTVAVEPTLTSVAVLGGIVLIRTFLSWSIELETEGRWPWQKASGSG